MGIEYVANYLGPSSTPRDIRQLRRSAAETLISFGSPVLVKHRYTALDKQAGIAQDSPNRHKGYSQARAYDPISHGTGFCSVELSPNEWITPDGAQIVTSNSNPGSGYLQAPMYRGYGPGYLIYVIIPDRPEDMIKLTETGILFRAQQGTAIAPWHPQITDNDLLINVSLNEDTGEIENTFERYTTKIMSPVTMRGHNRRGRREHASGQWVGNAWVVNQTFEMAKEPENSVVYSVETDR